MEGSYNITRRDFLKGAAATTGLAYLATQNGCATSQLSEAQQAYLDSHDFQAYAILVSQGSHPKETVKVRGWTKDDQLKLNGTPEQHARSLKLPLESILMRSQKTGAEFGDPAGTDLSTKGPDVKAKSLQVPIESLRRVADYFPDGMLRNQNGDVLTRDTYIQMVNSGEMRYVRIAYVASPKQEENAAKPAEPAKPAEKPAKPAEKKEGAKATSAPEKKGIPTFD